MRNQCLDKFSQIASRSDDDKWNELVKIVSDANYEMKIKEISNVF